MADEGEVEDDREGEGEGEASLRLQSSERVVKFYKPTKAKDPPLLEICH